MAQRRVGCGGAARPVMVQEDESAATTDAAKTRTHLLVRYCGVYAMGASKLEAAVSKGSRYTCSPLSPARERGSPQNPLEGGQCQH